MEAILDFWNDALVVLKVQVCVVRAGEYYAFQPGSSSGLQIWQQ